MDRKTQGFTLVERMMACCHAFHRHGGGVRRPSPRAQRLLAGGRDGDRMQNGLAAIAALLAGCASPGVQPPAAPLAGTAWQLVAIQSMDDAQGTTRITEPARFTLTFGKNGQATLQLDCNRGMGDFKAEPSADGTSGAISFGPIAATRALCPPPHLDERVARDMAYVRGYLLKDGKLYLTLMADGGTYEWAPLAE